VRGLASFADGSTLGERGSECGTVVLDEEHLDGARITLEEDGHVAPWSITCGVYGSMVHTRFFDTREEAEVAFVAMKTGLEGVLGRDDDSRFRDFVERFP
jgi:hypothetical protein